MLVEMGKSEGAHIKCKTSKTCVVEKSIKSFLKRKKDQSKRTSTSAWSIASSWDTQMWPPTTSNMTDVDWVQDMDDGAYSLCLSKSCQTLYAQSNTTWDPNPWFWHLKRNAQGWCANNYFTCRRWIRRGCLCLPVDVCKELRNFYCASLNETWSKAEVGVILSYWRINTHISCELLSRDMNTGRRIFQQGGQVTPGALHTLEFWLNPLFLSFFCH